ncbi:NAD-binding protein [Paracoccus sp. S3-43]|uniref:NAD-binding protein n=1 Tax=Paracoccus sp. S3-43 TaxID=3030011 RepID=UPI0023AE97C7|nr:NAD-binding protein [Paracoccus sp. S3-43]WEF25916.1 NAD-binding protein [Paracoccus sp. S3-43]
MFSGDISPEFGLALVSKDLNLALACGARLDVPVGLGAAASQVYALSRADGFGSDDWSAVIDTLRLKAALSGKEFGGHESC